MKKLQRYQVYSTGRAILNPLPEGAYFACTSDDVAVLEAENERLLTDLEKLARKWISDEAESKGWFQSHNGNSCAEQLRAILNATAEAASAGGDREQEKQL